jgi:hypothetical protein
VAAVRWIRTDDYLYRATEQTHRSVVARNPFDAANVRFEGRRGRTKDNIKLDIMEVHGTDCVQGCAICAPPHRTPAHVYIRKTPQHSRPISRQSCLRTSPRYKHLCRNAPSEVSVPLCEGQGVVVTVVTGMLRRVDTASQ